MSTKSEIDRLADFLLKNYPDEPGKTGVSESAVDVAIRLLTEKKGKQTNTLLNIFRGRNVQLIVNVLNI